MTSISLTFKGPFTFIGGDNSVFHSPFTDSPGIYLWTIKQRQDNSHLIHYVGETTSFGNRHREHLTRILGLDYGIFAPDKAQEGIRELLWDGLWRDKSPDGSSKQIKAYQKVHDDVIRYLAVLSIFFAKLTTDTQNRKHIEGCIGWNLRNNNPKDTMLYPDDNRVTTMTEKNHGELLVTSPVFIRGLCSRMKY